MLVDGATCEQITGPDFSVIPGPGADDSLRRKLAKYGHGRLVQGGEE
jgi:hypothetical protein